MSNSPEIAKANLSESTMISDLDLSLQIDQLVKQLKDDGRSREKIEYDLSFEVERACDELFIEDES